MHIWHESRSLLYIHPILYCLTRGKIALYRGGGASNFLVERVITFGLSGGMKEKKKKKKHQNCIFFFFFSTMKYHLTINYPDFKAQKIGFVKVIFKTFEILFFKILSR